MGQGQRALVCLFRMHITKVLILGVVCAIAALAAEPQGHAAAVALEATAPSTFSCQKIQYNKNDRWSQCPPVLEEDLGLIDWSGIDDWPVQVNAYTSSDCSGTPTVATTTMGEMFSWKQVSQVTHS